MKSTRLQKLVSGILVGAVLLVAANAWLAFRAEQVLADTEFWVAHTWEVIAGLDHAIGLVNDEESGARGYLITGDPAYLDADNAGRQRFAIEIAHLRALVQDNPRQTHSVDQLESAAGARLDQLARIVEVRRKYGESAAFAVVRNGSGIAQMQQLRSLVAAMQREEHGLLTVRLRASARARAQARAAVAFASALDILFIVITLWSLGYERRLRHRAAETAGRLEKLQAISDVGLTRLSLAELTNAMLERLRRVAGIDAVALCRRHGNEVEVAAVDGPDLAIGQRLPLSADGPLGKAIADNRVVSLRGSEVSSLAIPAFEKEMRSILVLPLTMSAQVIGLVIAGRRGDNAFSGQDEQLLSVVADRIALAIDRATLFEAEHAARRLAEEAAAEVKLLNAELEERVRQRTAELEATNSELEAFSYSVSHDLRAPLRSVDGFSVALAEDYGAQLTGDGRHYLGRIRAGVQRMGQLIDALLQLSRITRAELVVEPVSLSGLAAEVARELEQQNPDRQIAFHLQPDLEAEGDPRLLRAVFENMLGNAVKFTANVEQARIDFGYSPERAAYFIRDNGAGFDQQYARKLFVAFQRLHGEKDFKGSGIGLATVARVIRRHHGTMGAEGAIGLGATFWFTLGTQS